MGSERTQVHYNVGAQGLGGFPFQSYNETFIETGIAAPFSIGKFTDGMCWIGNDKDGQRAAWYLRFFQPQRVSTFAVEQIWQSYATVADAIAFTWMWNGHLFYQVTFPTAGATWVYDKTLSDLLQRAIWFERNYYTSGAALVARPELFHAWCYGKQLVGSGGGDGAPGTIYYYEGDNTGFHAYTDSGQPIYRDRIAPHLESMNKRIEYNRIEFECTRGTGGQLMICWSNDGGNTWGAWHTLSVGLASVFTQRVYYNRAGYARDRVFWLRQTDSTYNGIVGAELDAIALGS
jgi:hypothetical protein